MITIATVFSGFGGGARQCSWELREPAVSDAPPESLIFDYKLFVWLFIFYSGLSTSFTRSSFELEERVEVETHQEEAAEISFSQSCWS